MPRQTIKPEKDDTHSGEEGNKFASEQVNKSRLAGDQRLKAKTQVKKGERDPGNRPKAKYLPTRSAREPFN